MDFLLFTLTLGCFLILPSPSLQMVELELPQYLAVSSTMKINCSYQVTSQPIRLGLENGHQNLMASWVFKENTYVLDLGSRVTLELNLNPSFENGRYTFVFSQQLSCSDFTWYRCKVETPAVFSSNKTLQVAPEITSVALSGGFPAVQPSVNEFSIFVCMATISKEGTYSVRWFKGSNPSRNELSSGQTQLLRQNGCSRTITNELRYNVTESDVPNLILTCQVNAGLLIEKTENFTIPEMATTPAPPISEAVKAGLDPGSIVGIVLGVTATIVLVVLLVWFLVIRPKRLKAGGSEGNTPEPYTKDYQVQDNVLYATVDPLKKQKHKSSSSSLVDGPDTNSNSVQDTGTADKKQKSNKKSAFLPSSGDATDNMDDAYELPPPPPPPPTMPKPHRSPRIEPDNPLHYAELELAVHKSAKRRSKYTPKSNTEYADIALS